ncbi:MAG: undecaprenyl-diphosphate phosphatase [Halioglobus sp.]
MDTWQAVWLALLQGFTEFLPISSSAHLIFPSLLLGWPDQGLAFDVAVHVGTLLAVVLYYRADLVEMTCAWFASFGPTGPSDDSRLVWCIGLATIPAGLVGVLAGDFIENHLRSLPVIATTTLVFGILLGLAQRYSNSLQPAADRAMTLPLALLIGLAQACAPVPGVSRSGVTITAGLYLGLSRQSAARFSFLLSIPIIASAGALQVFKLVKSDVAIDWLVLCVGVVVSALTAYACIAVFLRLLDRVGLVPFVYYRVVLAAVLYGVWLFW